MNHELRIAVFSLAYSPVVGGAEIAVKEITDRIPSADFTCFTHRFQKELPMQEKLGNVNIVRLGSVPPNYLLPFAKLSYIFRAWRAAERAHKQKPFTAIWAIMAAYGGLAALLFKLRHPRIPMLLTLQEGDSETHILRRVGPFYFLWKLIFKKADYVQAISTFLAEFGKRHGVHCPVEVVPNGVDVEKYGNLEVEKLSNPFQHVSKNFNKYPIRVITTSRLVHKNGIDTLIKAWADVQRPKDVGHPHSKLLILGSGPDERKLKALAKELNVADSVEFLGHVEPSQIPHYLSRATIFVRASRSEGLGSSFLEAMAAGLPIIGTNVGGIPDFLINIKTSDVSRTSDVKDINANGLFAEVDNPQDLAGKIAFLLQDEKLRKRLSENGKKLVHEKYAWDTIATRMNSIFKSLATNYRLPTATILLATGLYPPEAGGPATYAALVERELPKRGIAVKVLPFRVVRWLPPLIRHFVFLKLALWHGLRKKVIFAQDTISVGLPAMCAAKILRKPFVIRVPGDYVWEQARQRFGVTDGIDEFQNKKYGWRVEFMRRIQKWVVGSADAVITPSDYFKKLVSSWVSTPSKVVRIYNGINVRTSDVHSRTHNAPKIIISAGRLVPWKGFDILIEIMKDLPDWQLKIVGDGPERKALELRIMNHELSKRVELLGRVPREKLMKLLGEARVFVLNTSFESFSFQIVEAMHAGVPVVTTHIGNLAEIIDNEKEGILVEPNSKAQLVAAIKKLDENEAFRSSVIADAKQKAQQFSVEKTVDQLTRLLNQISA